MSSFRRFLLLVVIGLKLAVTTHGIQAEPAVDTHGVWNWHAQSTAVVQGTPAFTAAYSGPNSLDPDGQVKETVSFDLTAGVRPWRGGEAFVDGLVWQGFGLSNATGVDGFPNGESFRLGTRKPNARIVRLFLRQTIGFGGEREKVEDDAFALKGTRDASRLTITAGKLNAKDIFDNNAYANDPRTQFLNWALMANEAWDYPADSLGFTNGFAFEWNQPGWAVRTGLFQLPREANGLPMDSHLRRAHGSVIELERDYHCGGRTGAARVLLFENRAHMGSYREAIESPVRPADIQATRSDRGKRGVGLNLEQEIGAGVGCFTRLGWSDGRNEAWAFSDVDRTATVGISVRGDAWGRTRDTLGFAAVGNGISAVHRQFLAAGGTGILAGDGALHYGTEQIAETYYDWQAVKGVNVALDVQTVQHPAFNRDRGPVMVFGFRIHVEQ